MEMCPTLAAAQKSIEELAFNHLTFHMTRSYFDSYNKIRIVTRMKFRHKFYLEDFEANAKDDLILRIRKIMFSRLSLEMIRIGEIIQMQDQCNVPFSVVTTSVGR